MVDPRNGIDEVCQKQRHGGWGPSQRSGFLLHGEGSDAAAESLVVMGADKSAEMAEVQRTGLLSMRSPVLYMIVQSQ